MKDWKSLLGKEITYKDREYTIKAFVAAVDEKGNFTLHALDKEACPREITDESGEVWCHNLSKLPSSWCTKEMMDYLFRSLKSGKLDADKAYKKAGREEGGGFMAPCAFS